MAACHLGVTTVNRLLITTALIASVAPAFALSLTTVDPGTHFPASTFAEARGLSQTSNFKGQLRQGAGSTSQNPGNGDFWKTARLFQVDYTAATETFRLRVWDDTTDAGAVMIDINRVMPTTAGKDFIGLRLDARANPINNAASSITVRDTKFNGVSTPSLGNSAASTFYSTGTVHYFDGPVSDFNLSGVAVMDWTGNHSSDRLSFDIKMLEASPVPEPASMAALGLGALGLLRRRRKA